MLSRTQKPLVISPNYRLAIKRKNENFSIEQPSQIGGEKPVKTKKLRILNEFRKKEENWNSRFVNFNIPEYSCFRDKYCEGYIQNIAKKKRFKIEFAPGKIRKKPSDITNEASSVQRNTKYRPDSMDNRKPPTSENPFIIKINKHMKKKAINLEFQNEALRNMRDELVKLWEKNNVPEHHREIFDICCKNASLQRLHEIISKEIEEIQSKKSSVLACIKAITAREGCLGHLKHAEKSIKASLEDQENIDSENFEELISKSSELLTHLRMLSLNVVECINKWKENFSYLFLLANSACIKQGALFLPYLYNNENYLLKMMKDLDFLSYSSLNNFFNFSARNDPFLITLKKEVPQQSNKIAHIISPNLINRIKICEALLTEEVLNEKTNKGKYLPGQQIDLKFPNIQDNDSNPMQFRGNAAAIYFTKPLSSNKPNLPKDHRYLNRTPNNNTQHLDNSDKKNTSFNKKEGSSAGKNNNFSVKSPADNSPLYEPKNKGKSVTPESEKIVENQAKHEKKKTVNERKEEKGPFPYNLNQEVTPKNKEENMDYNDDKDFKENDLLAKEKHEEFHKHDVESKETTPYKNDESEFHKNQNEDELKKNDHSHSVDNDPYKNDINFDDNSEKHEELPENTSISKIQESKMTNNAKSKVESSHEIVDEALPKSNTYDQTNHPSLEKSKITEDTKSKMQNSIEVAENTHSKSSKTKKMVLSVHPPKDLYEEELENFLEKYVEQVPHDIISTFPISVPDILTKASEEDLNFLEFHDEKAEMIGLAIVHVDKSFLSYKRISIIHFSLKYNDLELLNQAAQKLLIWIWTNDNCEEIRVNLYHSLNENSDELELNKSFQDIFTSKGFRWKLLTNDKTSGTRFTIFGLRRKVEEFQPPDIQSEPIIFRSCVILSDSMDINNNNEINEVYDNVNCQLNALSTFKKEYADGEISENLNSLLETIKAQPNFVFQGMKCKELESLSSCCKFLSDNNFDDVKELIWKNEDIEEKIVCSLLKACYRWENFRTVNVMQNKKNASFLRIIPEIKDLYCVSVVGETSIYILPTDEEKMKVFIYNIDEENIDRFTDNETFSLYVRETMKSIEETQILEKEIWIPCFKKNSKISKIPQISHPKTALESFDFSINYENRLGGLLATRKNEDQYHIIKPPFVFGLLHTDLEERIEIHYSAVLVTEKDCV